MTNRPRTAATSQRGFALLMVMFLTTIVLLVAIAAAPNIRTEVQREREEEMIWRGKQYVRGIKFYYKKTGRFPTSVDDLTKQKLGSLRFMRQAYKDPMNKEDGSWRFIYIGPSGQLIGSLKPAQTFQIPGLNGAPPGTPAGAKAQQTVSFGASGFGQSPQQGSQGQQGGNQPNNPGQQGSGQQAAGQTGAGAQTSGNGPSDDAANAVPSGLTSTDSPLLGGNIIGVGSKINKRSVMVYDKAKNYRLFEFVWNPAKEMASAVNQQIGAPAQNQQGLRQGQTGFQTGLGSGQQNNQQQNNQQSPGANSPDMPLPTPPEQPPTPPQQ